MKNIIRDGNDVYVAPEGYKFIKVSKSERCQIVLRPETKQGIKDLAKISGLSFNELVHQILDEYLEKKQGEK